MKMIQWEYKFHRFVEGVTTNQVLQVLNMFGSQGWEVICWKEARVPGGSTKDTLILLKRPIGHLVREDDNVRI